MTDAQPGRGWLLAILFAAFGLLNIADYFYASREDIHRIVSGVGFLLMAPHAFFHPIRFTKPIRAQFEGPSRALTPLDGLAVIGVVFLVAGLMMRWL